MDTDQTSEKMLKPGEHSSSSPQAATIDEKTILSQSVNSRGHKQCAMLFRRYVSRTAAGSGRAVLEGVGLTHETIEMCYKNSPQNEEEAIQSGLMKWRNGSGDSTTWAVLIEAMDYAQIGTQHIEAMKKELLKGDLEESKTTEHSSAIELSRKRRRLSITSSDVLMLQQPVAKKCLHDYMDLKLDLLAQDIADFHSESDPSDIIRLLYSNFLTRIAKLLTPHFAEVKIAADNHYQLGLHKASVAEGTIASAESVDGLFSVMFVKRMWDNTRFFRKVVAAIPESAVERQAAEGILLHYNMHLAIYERATLLRDALAKETKMDAKRMGSNEEDKLNPLKITSAKPISGFTSEDCYRIQARLLSTAYHIPQEKIICQDADESRSTTVTFLVPCQYIHDIVQCSTKLPTVWILLELTIIEVSIPGVFTFIPSVGCFLSLLRGSKTFTADLLEVTEVLPYQTYCLLDPNTKEPLSGRPLSTKRIEQYWDSHGDLVPDLHGSVPESGDIEILDTHSEKAVIPPNDHDVRATDELQSKVGELEDKVKDLERKVANLFMDNVALKTKLEASREVERQQEEEIARLKERLDTTTQELSLSRTRESELEEKTKVLEETRSDLETEVEKLEKQIKQLEILPSDVEQLTKSEKAVIPPKDSDVGATDESKVGELEDKVKDLEQKVANLFMDNVALKTKLEASREAERQQYEEIARLKERLVRAQDTATQEQSLSRTRESQLEEKIVVLEETRSDLEAEVEKLEKQMKQLEILPSDIEQFAKVSGRPPVVEAARLGQLSAVKMLLDSGTATVEDRDKEGKTALLWASYSGHLPVVRELVKVYKAHLFQKDKEGRNAMHFAAEGGHIEVIQFLQPLFGARVHERDTFSYTMLHWAARGGHCQVACYLITELKLDPQDREMWGNTALLRAAHGGSVPLVRALLEEYGSTLDEVDVDRQNAMHKAAAGGSLDVIKFLAPLFGARVHEKDADSYTMLHWAAQNGHCHVARYLIETLNMDLQDRDKYGRTAVLLAAQCGHLGLVRALVEQHRADLLHKSNDGWNALHLAAAKGHLDVVKYLIPRFGQHRFNKDNVGRTCLDLAVAEGKHNVVEYLQQEGGFSDRQ